MCRYRDRSGKEFPSTAIPRLREAEFLVHHTPKKLADVRLIRIPKIFLHFLRWREPFDNLTAIPCRINAFNKMFRKAADGFFFCLPRNSLRPDVKIPETIKALP